MVEENGSGAQQLSSGVLESVRLDLEIREPELIEELACHPAGRERDEYALRALRVGLLTLKHARGQIDAEAVRREGERILSKVQRGLAEHRAGLQARLEETLKAYFDPSNGSFPQRIERLVSREGELEQAMRRVVGSKDSMLQTTLDGHFGPESRLMTLLSPSDSTGLLATLRQEVERQLKQQREAVVREFSLDSDDSALSRLVAQLKSSHGSLTEAVREKVDALVKEFSLDEDSSALARLQKTLVETLKAQQKEALDFHKEVIERLSRMEGEKAEAARGTRHGLTFQEAVLRHVKAISDAAGDVASFTGDTPGLIRNRKFGDVVIELGPEAIGAGAKVVVEAKEDASYHLDRARQEMEQARKNRGAGFGVFVFSQTTAPARQPNLLRIDHDVYVIWDAENPSSDVVLDAGLAVAKALAVRAGRAKEGRAVDLTELDRTILEVEKQSNGLDEINTWAETIQSNSAKILDKVRRARTALQRQVQGLRGFLAALRAEGS